MGAHPDDPEHMAAGTTALATAAGKRVVWCVATRGERWHVDPDVIDPEAIAGVRSAEAATAARLLGAEPPRFLDEPDGDVCATRLAGKLMEVLRDVQAACIITHSPQEDEHPDHHSVVRAVLRCCNRAGEPTPLANPRWHTESAPYAGPSRVFLTARRADLHRPEAVFVDVTPVVDRKVGALLAHASQVRDARVMEEVVRFTASLAGNAAGVRYAEAFYPAPGYANRRVLSGIPE